MIKRFTALIILFTSIVNTSFAQFSSGCIYNTEIWLNQSTLPAGTGLFSKWRDKHNIVTNGSGTLIFNTEGRSSNAFLPSQSQNQLNGYKTVLFGADDFLMITGDSAGLAAGPAVPGVGSSEIALYDAEVSIYIVAKVTSGKPLLTYGRSGQSLISFESDAFYWGNRTDANRKLTFGSAMSSNFEIRSAHAFVLGIGESEFRSTKNGVQDAYSLKTTDYFINSSTTDTLFIGKRWGNINQAAGAANGADQEFNGEIAEIIWFKDWHTPGTKDVKVNSFLSLKYGISQDGTTTPYHEQGGTSVWDYNSCNNSSFSNRITGIFRSDCFSHSHLKSTNVETNSILTGALGTNFSSPSSFSKNKQHFLWGDDNGALTFSETSDVPTGGYTRLNRRWKINEFLNGSSVGDVTFEFDLSSTGIPDGIAETNLIILVDTDNDGVFTDETGYSPNTGTWNGSTKVGKFTHDFASCNLMTFAFKSTALPVTWLSFDAVKDNNTVEIRWITGVEINNSHFIIERSLDGETWTEIGQISGKGDFNGVSDYNFNDFYPSEGVNYYRVKQVDYDGMLSYSLVKSVVFMTNVLASSKIYPNPANETLTIEIPFNTDNVNYKIIDLSGGVVKAGIFHSDKTNLDIQDLKKGVYMISLSNSTVNQTHRLIVN